MSAAIGKLTFAPMTQEDAEAIADWQYEPPYDFYDARADPGDLALLLDPARRADSSFSVRDETGELLGFFTYAPAGDAIVLGLGLRPDATGRGLGRTFVAEGLEFARTRYAPHRFRLSVAEFNARAVKVYERSGFLRTRAFVHETNGGLHHFVEMERPA